jgi:hypothetical protein
MRIGDAALNKQNIKSCKAYLNLRWPASKHVKELVTGSYLIISVLDLNLRLQLKE